MCNMGQPLDRAAVGRSLLSEAAANALDLDYQQRQGGGLQHPDGIAMDVG